MKKIIASLLVFSLALSLCACGKETEITTTQTEPYILPTTIIDADVSLPYNSADSFAPYEAKSVFNRDLMAVLYESLFVQSTDGKGKMLLASSVVTEERSVTVELINGVSFSDGTMLTADHVKKSFELARTNAYYEDSLSNISSVTVVDNNTVVFQLYNPDAMVLNTLCFPVVHLSGDSYVGSGKYYIDFLDDVPYLAVNTSHRDYNANWNKQIALYDMAGVSSPIYPFKANEISVYRDDLSDGEYTNLSSLTVSENMNNLVYIGVNTKWAGTVVSSSWFRRVLNTGINRRDIASKSFLGQTEAVSSFFREDFYMLDGVSRPVIEGDISTAVAILEENGYDSFTDDGTRTNGSYPLNIRILVCNINPYKVGVAEAVKSSLEAMGMSVTIQEASTMEDYIALLEEGYFDLYIGETQLTSGYYLDEFFSTDGALSYGIDEVFFEAYDKYKSGEFDIDTFVWSCNDFVPVIPLFYRRSVVSVNPNLTGVNMSTAVYDGVCNWKLN